MRSLTSTPSTSQILSSLSSENLPRDKSRFTVGSLTPSCTANSLYDIPCARNRALTPRTSTVVALILVTRVKYRIMIPSASPVVCTALDFAIAAVSSHSAPATSSPLREEDIIGTQQISLEILGTGECIPSRRVHSEELD